MLLMIRDQATWPALNHRLVQQGAAITVGISCRSRCRTQSTLITVASITFTNSQTFYSGLTKHCTSHQSAAAATAMSMMWLQKLPRLLNLLNNRISPVGLDLLHHPNKNPQQSASSVDLKPFQILGLLS